MSIDSLSHSLEQGTVDIAIIGAGVVDCALARRLVLKGARVTILEKAADVLDGASKEQFLGQRPAADSGLAKTQRTTHLCTGWWRTHRQHGSQLGAITGYKEPELKLPPA